MPNRIKDRTGQKVGKWTVVKVVSIHKRYGAKWLCVCDCGTYREIQNGNIGHSTNCGCVRKIDSNRKTKQCSRCKREKDINLFNKNKSRNDGHSQFCRECISEMDKEYRPKNREYKNNYQNERRNTDINIKIADNCRRRINYAIKKESKTLQHTLDLLGCSIEFLKIHLQNNFDDKMSWNNYGKYWEIDHIKPVSWFEDLSNYQQQSECFNWKNLQPLEKIENIRKGNKYNG